MSISTKDFVHDMCKYVVSTGFFEKIKIVASANDVIVESLEKDNEVVLKGKFKEGITGIDGEFGLSNLDLLKHITNDSEFSLPETALKIVTETKGNEVIPTEFAYENKSKTFINYRFMPKQFVPNQPTFKDPVWEITINPSKLSTQQFNWAAAGLGSYEQYFIPKVVNGELKFFIGEDAAAAQRGGIVFSSNIKVPFDTKHKWKIAPIQTVLKLADSADCDLSFSTKGAIRITLNTGIGEYKFLFPAKIK